MTAYVALLRAVNVGGRKLVMSDLKAIGDELGFGSARTFIASGNLVFTSSEDEATVQSLLEARLAKHMNAPVPTLIRTAGEMQAVAAANPFEGELPGSQIVAIFLNGRPPADTAAQVKNCVDERIALGEREIYVAYPRGMADTKLRIPAADGGTARNMNSVAKLAALAKELE